MVFPENSSRKLTVWNIIIMSTIFPTSVEQYYVHRLLLELSV